MDYSLRYGGFSRPTLTSQIASPGYAPYDGGTRKETRDARSEDLQNSRKRRQAKLLVNQAERARHVVDKGLADGNSVGDDEIQYLYTTIKSNVLRIVRTYFNSVIPALPDNSDSGNPEIRDPHELISIDHHEQADLFSNWSARGEIRVFRVSGKIFEIIHQRIFGARCFGEELDEEERLAEYEAGLRDSTGQCLFPHMEAANIQLALPSESHEWRLGKIQRACSREVRYNRARQAARIIIAFLEPVRLMKKTDRNVFKFASEVQMEVRLLCEMALDLSLAIRATKFAFEFRSIDVGVPITSLKGPDFDVGAFVDGSKPQSFESCKVAATVFHALLRSRSLGSRPTMLIAKALVISSGGHNADLQSGSRDVIALQRDHRRPRRLERQHKEQLDSDYFQHAKNIIVRRIADELSA